MAEALIVYLAEEYLGPLNRLNLAAPVVIPVPDDCEDRVEWIKNALDTNFDITERNNYIDGLFTTGCGRFDAVVSTTTCNDGIDDIDVMTVMTHHVVIAPQINL